MPVIERRTADVRRELTLLDAARRQQAVALKALSASQAQLAHRRDALTRPENEGRLRSRELMSSAQLERSEEHTSELQSLMRISYSVFCLKKKKQQATAR